MSNLKAWLKKSVLSVSALSVVLSLSACGTQASPNVAPVSKNSTGFGIKSTQSVQAPQRVLMVIANRDFWYADYANTRRGLLEAGIEVRVAAASTAMAIPTPNSGQGSASGVVYPDLSLDQVQAEDYDAIFFAGGWGASVYQYGYTGSYLNSQFNGSAALRQRSNALINAFLAQGKVVSALCHGVTALAYARVDGVSPLQGRRVVAWNQGAPASTGGTHPDTTRWHVEANGAQMYASGAVGDPSTAADDVVSDGQILTGENEFSGYRLGQTLAQRLMSTAAPAPSAEPSPEPTTAPTAASSPVATPTAAPTPVPTAVPTQAPAPVATPSATPIPLKPVLMVIANQDFYYREYGVTRAELEAAGVPVRVAAGTTAVSYPHPNSGQGSGNGAVRPDLALSEVNSQDYSAILFVGGWGSSTYQYAFPGSYVHTPYNGDAAVKATVNRLIGEFSAQNKYLTAICHGVSVLAWARVDGVSPLRGRRATGGPWLPNVVNNAYPLTTRWYIEANQGTHVPSRSVGNTSTSADDVIVDGRVITAEDFDTAEIFARTVAARLQP